MSLQINTTINDKLCDLQTKAGQLKRLQHKFTVIETNRLDSSLLMPLAQHLYFAFLVQKTED